MKKLTISLTAIMATIVIIITCAVTVSADDGAYYKFKPNFDFDTDYASYFYMHGTDTRDLSWSDNTNQAFSFYEIEPTDWDGEWATFEFRPNDNYDFSVLVMPLGKSTLSSDGSSVELTSLDTLFLDPGRFFAEIETQLDAFHNVRFTLRPAVKIGGGSKDFFGAVYAYTDTLDIYITDGSRSYFDYPRLDFTYTDLYEGSVTTPVFLCVEFLFSTADPLDITIVNMEQSAVNLFYGSGSSPNNPIYPSAPGGNVGNLDDAEQELIGSQQQGLDNTGTVIGNAQNVIVDMNTDLQLGSFVLALNPILDKLTTIAGIDALVNMSLALGLFASLLSLGASIIGAGGKRDSNNKSKERDASREKAVKK